MNFEFMTIDTPLPPYMPLPIALTCLLYTSTQGGDTIADYITADTKLPAYRPYPRFLFKMEISQTAKLLYSLLLDRSTLSQLSLIHILRLLMCHKVTHEFERPPYTIPCPYKLQKAD